MGRLKGACPDNKGIGQAADMEYRYDPVVEVDIR